MITSILIFKRQLIFHLQKRIRKPGRSANGATRNVSERDSIRLLFSGGFILSGCGGVRVLNGGGHQRELILVGLQIGGAEGDELHIAVIGEGSKWLRQKRQWNVDFAG